ncbi:MAG: DUF4159 domain-containing protein [Pedosphaera sp.]|nr:DUF4159 domain-containing protein [Pedosphaera sp.]
MKKKLALIAVTIALAGGLVWAQRTAREAEQNSVPTPEWKNDPEFEKDTFTFARVKYSVDGRYGMGHTRERWKIDFPDSDLNFSYRLQQMTSLKVDPNGRVIELTEKDLSDHPFIYIVEPGKLTFEDAEIPVLRSYLLNGGFLMVDDFWGDRDWYNFADQLKLVFPDKDPKDLALDHPVFHSIFDLDEKPQVPGIEWGLRGMTYEQHGPGCEEVQYRGIFDDKGRLMVMICHNTDLGDGWEREGENETYFHRFSEKKAYPMGINIVFYAMTH